MIDQLWLLICSGLVLLMQAGFMCLESGLTRSKNSINVAVKNLSDFGVSVALFWMLGYGIMFGLSRGQLIGTTDFFFNSGNDSSTATFFLYQAMFCGTATTIISGAIAERLKFSAYIFIAVLVSGFIYPIYGHWAWNEGEWLYQLGFLDFAGSTVVHGMGAWVSLATLVIIGSRAGKFTDAGEQKIQGSNLPFAVLGTLLLWVGWIGFNGGSTFALNDEVPNIIVNTVLAGIAGMVASMILSQIQSKRVEVEELINGSLAGLVAITACCNVVSNPIAVIVGITAAGFTKAISVLLRKQKIDDAVDVIAVHGGAGMWGTICVGLFGTVDNRYSQILVQLLGVGVALLWGAGLTWGLLFLLNRWQPLRVSLEDETIGLNISEHGAKTDAYDLFQVMDHQAKTQDLTLRVPVEPFTEVGHIATRYNQVMDSLERNHRTNTESLEDLYAITAIAVAALDNRHFEPESFDTFGDRPDELGILARSLQQLLTLINEQQDKINHLQQQNATQLPLILSIIFHERFGKTIKFYQARLAEIQVGEVSEVVQQAISSETFDAFQQNYSAKSNTSN